MNKFECRKAIVETLNHDNLFNAHEADQYNFLIESLDKDKSYNLKAQLFEAFYSYIKKYENDRLTLVELCEVLAKAKEIPFWLNLEIRSNYQISVSVSHRKNQMNINLFDNEFAPFVLYKQPRSRRILCNTSTNWDYVKDIGLFMFVIMIITIFSGLFKPRHVGNTTSVIILFILFVIYFITRKRYISIETDRLENNITIKYYTVLSKIQQLKKINFVYYTFLKKVKKSRIYYTLELTDTNHKTTVINCDDYGMTKEIIFKIKNEL